MCFRRSRHYWEERTRETGAERIWDLFYRETEHSEPPLPVLEEDEEPVVERDDEVPAAAER